MFTQSKFPVGNIYISRNEMARVHRMHEQMIQIERAMKETPNEEIARWYATSLVGLLRAMREEIDVAKIELENAIFAYDNRINPTPESAEKHVGTLTQALDRVKGIYIDVEEGEQEVDDDDLDDDDFNDDDDIDGGF